jgi:transcriptional regulator with PAS, ATPase and Fis domain
MGNSCLVRAHTHANIIGHEAGLRNVLDLVDRVAGTSANVLIQGESGTGKELVANAIHTGSARANGPFIKINCAAIPADLVESELFGAAKGAYTGATGDRKGLFELAEHGSLLLDEIGEAPLSVQVKLLRVLQEHEYRPVGGGRTLIADFRLISATNTDPEQAVREGRLREDLYFRLNTIVLTIPPLRSRSDDIPLLCDHFLEKYCRVHQFDLKILSAAALAQLMQYRWRGNVRELEHAIERGVVMSRGLEIMLSDLPDAIQPDAGAALPVQILSPGTLAEIEKLAIVRALDSASGNKKKAARILGLYRPTLYNKMKKHGIDVVASGRLKKAGARAAVTLN